MRPRLLAIATLCLLTVFGAGCSRPPTVGTSGFVSKPGDITSQFLSAHILPGVEVSTIGPGSFRRLRATLGPTFTDNNGTYPGQFRGERIDVHLSLLGSADADQKDMRASLSHPVEWTDGPWHLIGGTNTRTTSTIIYASLTETGVRPAMHHTITCASAPFVEPAFWDICRTFIETARITTVPGEVLNTK